MKTKAPVLFLSAVRASANCQPPIALRNKSNGVHEDRQSSIGITTAPNRTLQPRRFFSTANNKAKNRIYDAVRRPDELATYILSSTSSRTPLITLWTASWCSSCRTVKPLLNSLIESGVGEPEGGVTFCEVELDSRDIMDSGLGMQYMITSIPTLLTFDRGEAITESRTMDTLRLKDKRWMTEWIEGEAKRRGYGTGGGGAVANGLFGGLFGDRR